MDREVDKLGQIKTVEPDDRILVATFFIGPFFAVVMPVPHGSDDDITRIHDHPLTLYCCETTLALDNEADGKGGMAVRRSRLARHDKLQASIQCVRGVRGGCLT